MALRDRFSRRATISNARWFVAGKLISALATVTWLWLVTRALLPQGELAVYLTAIAYLETALAFSLFGLDWLLIRHLPAAAAAGDTLGMRRLLRATLLARAGLVLGAALVLAGAAAALGRPAALGGVLLPLLVLLLLSEALLRLLRDNTLESLAAQRYTQLGVLGRTLLALAGYGLLRAVDLPVNVNALLGLELLASMTMLVAVGTWVARMLPREDAEPSTAAAPRFVDAWRACWPNYVAAFISLPLASQSLLLALSHVVTAAALAPLGLALRVFEIMRNYVPGLLLMNVLRPRLIGGYAVHGDFSRTANEAALVSRWSAISVAPLVAWLGLYGDAALAAFAGHPLPGGLGLMLACMSATLLLRVHRQIGQVLVNIVSAQRLLTRLALLGLLGWPLAAWLAASGHAVWALPVALGWDEVAWVWGLSVGIRKSGSMWPNRLLFMTTLLALAAGAALLVGALPIPSTLMGLAVGSGVLIGLMVVALGLSGQLDWRGAMRVLRARD